MNITVRKTALRSVAKQSGLVFLSSFLATLLLTQIDDIENTFIHSLLIAVVTIILYYGIAYIVKLLS